MINVEEIVKPSYRKVYYEKNKARLKVKAAARYKRITSDPEKRAELMARMTARQNRHRKTINEANRLRGYNLTKEQYTALFAKQNFACAACGEKEPKSSRPWHIDHDHNCCPGAESCGQCVRGILCHHCNRGLGFLKDSIERLEKLIAYLKGGVSQ